MTNASGITANFGALAGNQVSLVVSPNGNGAVSVSPAKNVYTNGEAVTLTAVPAANQTFIGWSGDAAGNLNPLGLMLTSSKLITASFVPGSPTNSPVITQPPLSRTLGAGGNTFLSFQLTGDGPFAYQWRLNSLPVSGATNPTLTLTRRHPAPAGRYDVVVSGFERNGYKRARSGGVVGFGNGVEQRATPALADFGLRTRNEFSIGALVGIVADELESARASDADGQPALLRGLGGYEILPAFLSCGAAVGRRKTIARTFHKLRSRPTGGGGWASFAGVCLLIPPYGTATVRRRFVRDVKFPGWN